MRDYLVYIPTPNGYYRPKISEKRNFDLWTNIWDDHVISLAKSEYLTNCKRQMWPTIGSFEFPHYKAYCFLCDDVEIDTPTLNALFEQGIQAGLHLWQGTLEKDSVFGWPHLRTRGSGGLRRTNFVESMMPIFSAEALRKCQWTFNLNQSAWGLEWIWSLIVGEENMGVFDNLTARLDRNQTSDVRVFANGKNGQQEMEELLGTLNRRWKNLSKIY